MDLLPKIVIALALGVTSTLAQYTPPSVVTALLDKYRSYSNLTDVATDDETYAVNITTWQMSHGGFSKANEENYLSAWDGSATLSSWYNGTTPLGMFDNDATVSEIRFLCNQYKVSTNATHKAIFKTAVGKAIDFILTAQHSTGSWPQVYPARSVAYSNLATYNDNAMVRVMVLLKDIINSVAPFDSDIITSAQKTALTTALNKSVEFALKAQIVNGTTLTVWCQQHDPVTYAPDTARAYELPSKSGSESVGVAAFLMNWPDQTAAIQAAVNGAVQWFTKNRVANMAWVAPDFVTSSGASLWYRFYNVEDDQYFFCDRDGIKVYNITDISNERRTGYQWGGDYASKLLTAAASYAPPATTSSSSSVTSSSSATGEASIIKHGSGSSNQTIATGNSIVSFWYSWEYATGITVTGMVDGVSVVVDTTAKTVNLSGIVTASEGSYTYTLTTVGGTNVATKSGTFIVTGTTLIHPSLLGEIQKSVKGPSFDAQGRIRSSEDGENVVNVPKGVYWHRE